MYPEDIQIGRAIMIGVQIPNNPTQGMQIPLPLNGTIQQPDIEVVAVEAVSSAVMTIGPNGTNQYGTNVNMTLNLFAGSIQITQDMPLGLIDPAKNGGYLRTFRAFSISMQQSYITLTGPGGSYGAGTFIYLVFYIRNRITLR